jgi:hypothetical protein
MTAMLTFIFACQTFAGQMETLIATPPPSSVAADQMDTTVAGQMDTTSSEAVDPITQLALNVLQSVMSLF